jgi:hypothetical protein
MKKTGICLIFLSILFVFASVSFAGDPDVLTYSGGIKSLKVEAKMVEIQTSTGENQFLLFNDSSKITRGSETLTLEKLGDIMNDTPGLSASITCNKKFQIITMSVIMPSATKDDDSGKDKSPDKDSTAKNTAPASGSHVSGDLISIDLDKNLIVVKSVVKAQGQEKYTIGITSDTQVVSQGRDVAKISLRELKKLVDKSPVFVSLFSEAGDGNSQVTHEIFYSQKSVSFSGQIKYYSSKEFTIVGVNQGDDSYMGKNFTVSPDATIYYKDKNMSLKDFQTALSANSCWAYINFVSNSRKLVATLIEAYY